MSAESRHRKLQAREIAYIYDIPPWLITHHEHPCNTRRERLLWHFRWLVKRWWWVRNRARKLFAR